MRRNLAFSFGKYNHKPMVCLQRQSITYPSPQLLWQSSLGLTFPLHSVRIQGTNALFTWSNLPSPPNTYCLWWMTTQASGRLFPKVSDTWSRPGLLQLLSPHCSWESDFFLDLSSYDHTHMFQSRHYTSSLDAK